MACISVDKARKLEVSSQWQTQKNTVCERNKFMFGNELISDIKFTVGKRGRKCEIPAHKYVLGTASPVFFAMLYGDFVKDEVIAIDDCEADSFMELLRFIYYDEVHLNSTNVVDVLYLANKYIVPVLSKECVNFLLEHVESENVLGVLNAAICFGEKRLEKHCWSILSRLTSDILVSDSFADIDKQLLLSILEKDCLNVTEIEVFDAVKRWSEKECARQSLSISTENQKFVLKDIINLIRFPVMQPKDFAIGPACSDLLPLEDVKAIFIYLNSGLKIQNLRYPLTRRGFQPHVCARYIKPMRNYLWRYDEKDVDAIRFKVDQEIFLSGIGLYGSPSGGEYNVQITIRVDEEDIYKKMSQFTCPPDPDFNKIDNPQICEVSFEEPIRIRENTFYDIFVLLDGPPSFAGDDGRQEVKEEGVTFSFGNCNGSTNGTSYDEGQIPNLLFYF